MDQEEVFFTKKTNFFYQNNTGSKVKNYALLSITLFVLGGFFHKSMSVFQGCGARPKAPAPT